MQKFINDHPWMTLFIVISLINLIAGVSYLALTRNDKKDTANLSLNI